MGLDSSVVANTEECKQEIMEYMQYTLNSFNYSRLVNSLENNEEYIKQRTKFKECVTPAIASKLRKIIEQTVSTRLESLFNAVVPRSNEEIVEMIGQDVVLKLGKVPSISKLRQDLIYVITSYLCNNIFSMNYSLLLPNVSLARYIVTYGYLDEYASDIERALSASLDFNVCATNHVKHDNIQKTGLYNKKVSVEDVIKRLNVFLKSLCIDTNVERKEVVFNKIYNASRHNNDRGALDKIRDLKYYMDEYLNKSQFSKLINVDNISTDGIYNIGNISEIPTMSRQAHKYLVTYMTWDVTVNEIYDRHLTVDDIRLRVYFITIPVVVSLDYNNEVSMQVQIQDRFYKDSLGGYVFTSDNLAHHGGTDGVIENIYNSVNKYIEYTNNLYSAVKLNSKEEMKQVVKLLSKAKVMV